MDSPDPREEWEYLTFDTDESCAVCGRPIHAGQAVGHVDGVSVHAKCYSTSKKSA